VLDELIPSAWHHIERYANNPSETDYGRLQHRLRARRGLVTDTTAQTIIVGHAFVQNLRHGHDELGADLPPAQRVAAAFANSPQPADRARTADRRAHQSDNATAP
jgi:DDE domain